MDPAPSSHDKPKKSIAQQTERGRGQGRRGGGRGRGQHAAGRGTQPQPTGQIAPTTQPGHLRVQPQAAGPLSSSVAASFAPANPTMHYGAGAWDANRPGAPPAADAGRGTLVEGDCGTWTQKLIDKLEALQRRFPTDSFVVGVVLGSNGTFYATQSGNITTAFERAVTFVNEDGGKLVLVNATNIGKVAEAADGSAKLAKRSVRSYRHPDGDPNTKGDFHNHPKASNAPKGQEVASGAPGTCALPKLVDHLIGLDVFPMNASERWYAPKGNEISIKPFRGAEPNDYRSGESVPSCWTCRDIVPFQLDGLAESIASKPQREQAKADAAKAKQAEADAKKETEAGHAKTNRDADEKQRTHEAAAEQAAIERFRIELCGSLRAFVRDDENGNYLDKYDLWRTRYRTIIVPKYLAKLPALEQELRAQEANLLAMKGSPNEQVARQIAQRALDALNAGKESARVMLEGLDRRWDELPAEAFEWREEDEGIAGWMDDSNPWRTFTDLLQAIIQS